MNEEVFVILDEDGRVYRDKGRRLWVFDSFLKAQEALRVLGQGYFVRRAELSS